MSSAFTVLREKVATLEIRLTESQRDNYYPATARRRDQQIEASVDLATERWVSIPLGTIVKDEPKIAYGTFSYDSAYVTGGEAITTTRVPSVQTVLIGAAASGSGLVVSEYDSGKMKAYDAAGAEYANGTDLSAFANLPALFIGLARSDHEAYRSTGGELVLEVVLRTAAAVTADASNYWTLTLRHRKDGQTDGEKMGERATNIVGLTAQSDASLYEASSTPLLLDSGEFVALYTVATGTPVPIEDAVLWLRLRKNVR